MFKKIAIALSLATIASTTLTSCGGSSSNSIDAYVFLYDISGSAEATSYTPYDRRDQLITRLATSYSDRQALYFDFVRRDAGRQQVSSLVSPSFFLFVDDILDKEINDDGLRKEVVSGLSDVWSSLVSNQTLTESEECVTDVKGKANQASNGFFSASASSRIASKFCSTVRQALHTINEIPVVAETWRVNGIGSGIENAINVAIDKVESEELRLQRKYPDVTLNPTFVLTSDFDEVHDNAKFELVVALASVKDVDKACEMGTEDAGLAEQTILNIVVESDGFGTVRGGQVSGDMRDKFDSYWRCWFEARGISEVNLGDRGIDWSTL